MSSNEPYQDLVTKLLDAIHLFFGKPAHLGWLALVTTTITGSIGVIFNSICLYIYQDKSKFSNPIFSYLRWYCLNSLLVCFFSIFTFMSFVPRIFEWTNSYSSYAFSFYFVFQVINFGYFYGALLDIWITLERLSNTSEGIKKFLTKMPSISKLCILSIIFCLIADTPYYLIFSIKPLVFEIKISNLTNTTFRYTAWYIAESNFSKSPLGKGLLYLLYSFRDAFLMILEIVLSLMSVVSLRVYLKKKSILLNTWVNIKIETLFRNYLENLYSESFFKTSQSQSVSIGTRVSPMVSGSQSKIDTRSPGVRLTVLVIILSVLSIFEHIMAIITVVYPFLTGISVLLYEYFLFFYLYTIAFKHAVNFPLFLMFNKVFYRAFKKLIKFKPST